MQDHAPVPLIPEVSRTSTQGIPTASDSGTAEPLDIPKGVAAAAVPTPTTAVPTEATKIKTNKINEIRVKTDVLDLLISTKGGSILQVDLLTYPISLEEKDIPVRVLDRTKAYAAQSGLIGTTADLAPNHYAQFSATQSEFELLDGSDELVVPLTWTNGKGITVTKRYTFKKGSFLIGVDQEVDHQSNAL
jgi:YidC/Oxa1 family membrane protein insertase